MAVRVGELYALLRLDDARFKQSLKDAERQVGDLAKKTTAAFAAIAGSITAAAIASGRYADEMQAIAGQTGLAVESVQSLGYAAMQFNADLGLLQTSMRAFVRRSAEAAQGNESFLKTYQQLGITQAEVRDGLQDIEGLFLLVAERIAMLPTEAQRSAAAMQLLGDAGRQLVPMLSQGATGIRAAMEEARRLGIVTDREAVAALASFVGELDVLRAQLAGAGRAFASEFLPTLRAGVQLLSQGAAAISNLSAETRTLIGTVGIGTVGAVGSMAALTTGTWAAVRAWQALSTTLKLASGPAGWIALAASAAVSLAAGMGLASFHARSARQEVAQFATMGDIDRELEKVNQQLAEAESQLEALRRQWTTPVIGGPQMRFEAAPEDGSLMDQIEQLTAYRNALVEQRQELQRLHDQQQAFLDSLQTEFEAVASSESEAFQRWKDTVRDLRREFDVYRESLYMLQEFPDIGVDQEQLRRAVEHERVILLERELNIQKQIVDATKDALAWGGLLPEEAKDLEFELAMAEAAVSRLGHELRKAGEDLHLIEYRMPFERLQRSARHLALQFETGVRTAEQLAPIIDRALESIQALDDGTITYLETLRTWQQLQERIQAQLPGPLTPVTLPRPTTEPEVLPGEERIARSFARLRLQFEADLVPVEEAVARLVELRSELIRMAAASGSLASASDEQIQLYIQLTSALDQWLSSLESVPTRLEQIRADMERALGVGMAVESEIARALGLDFDPITYEMDVLIRTLREMVAETGTVTPEMEELARQLRRLASENEHLALVSGSVRAALDGLARNMGPLGRALSGAVTFDPRKGLGGFGFDPASFVTSAIGVAADLLFDASSGLGNSAAVLERAAEALENASHSWQRTLSESQFHELIGATPEEQIADLRQARQEAQAQIRELQAQWWQFWNAASRGARIRELEDVVKEIGRAIRELEEGWSTDLERRMDEILGVTPRSLQSAVAGAFSASTAEDFAKNIESALEGRVRNAFVTAFLESGVMAPLFEELGKQIRDSLLDIDISPDEMEGIRALMEEIKTRSEPLYALLDEMGLLAETTERLNNEFARMVNVPLGFRAIQALRFQSMTPQAIPSLSTTSIGPDGGGDIIIERLELPNVRNAQEFERELRQLQRRESLRRVGNSAAWRRLGR